ncbi:MAG: TIM barrel protein [Thermomicrobiales bacterium]
MPKRAVSTWSLHRTLGKFKSPTSNANGGVAPVASPDPSALALLDLPAELEQRGYDTLHLCHFHLPSTTPDYLQQLRAAFAEHQIGLDALLIDDGDLSDPGQADRAEVWIGEWLQVAHTLGAKRARVGAGRSAPTPEKLADSAVRLARLAEANPGIRLVTENWLGMMPDADSVLSVLEATGDNVGLMIDLGNWSGPGKYDELARIAPFAETCHAKCHFTGANPDADDFRQSLQILKDINYTGPLALIYDGPSDDEWTNLDTEYTILREVFS